MAASAFVIFHCSSAELQARAGFDGWVMLLRDEFDTEDQAWPQERAPTEDLHRRIASGEPSRLARVRRPAIASLPQPTQQPLGTAATTLPRRWVQKPTAAED